MIKHITILLLNIFRRIPLDDFLIKINGMMCDHCEKTVTQAAKSVKGVTKARRISRKVRPKVSFDSSLTDLEAIKKAIMDAGYEVIDEGEACPVPTQVSKPEVVVKRAG